MSHEFKKEHAYKICHECGVIAHIGDVRDREEDGYAFSFRHVIEHGGRLVTFFISTESPYWVCDVCVDDAADSMAEMEREEDRVNTP